MQLIRLNLLAGCIVAFSAVMARAGNEPRTFSFEGKDVAAARQRLAAGDPKTKLAVKSIQSEADKALELPPQSVTAKQPTAPSGDKHDYMSLSPYWWPDPNKPDGVPYMRKDGLVNPERSKYDLDPLDKLTKAVDSLSIAYYMTGDEKYGEKCAQLIRVWFLDDATKMNPNVKYAQFVPGYDETRPSGCIEANRLRSVIDADGLITGSKSWSADDHQKLQAWFKDFMHYLQTSPQGQKEFNQPNNHGTWLAVNLATYAMYLSDDAQAKEIIISAGQKRIASQIQPDGQQPLELQRTKAFDYSRFNVEALGMLALYGQRFGIDLWNFKTDDGRSIRVALDWLLPYASGEKKWEGQQIVDAKKVDAIRVYRWAANAYNDAKYEQVVKAAGDPSDSTTHRLELVYPRTTK
jgi:hypothetical protein